MKGKQNTHIDYTAFDEYLRQQEPSKQKAAANWKVAMGLQSVDGLQPSAYLVDVAKRNIEGEISIDESRELIKSYYQSKANRTSTGSEEEEADKVAANIAKILSSDTFAFNTNGYVSLHRRIFEGVFKHAGKIRQYDITKSEWVLKGGTVNYLNWEDLRRALDYDIEQEKAFKYKGLSMDDIVEHIAGFVSGIWQIHAFCEGNTRTTAVFTIQYLHSMGFMVDNDMFANHSWYFRNALVRANYKNVLLGIDYTPVYLIRFFRNLIMGEKWDLRNRYLHISPSAEWSVQPNLAYDSQMLNDDTGQVHDKIDEYGGQVQDKYGTSLSDVQHKCVSVSQQVRQLLCVFGDSAYSVKELMGYMNLRGRDNFLKLYFNPAVTAGLVCMQYPDSPRHPRQKYLLTAKGKALLEIMQ